MDTANLTCFVNNVYSWSLYYYSQLSSYHNHAFQEGALDNILSSFTKIEVGIRSKIEFVNNVVTDVRRTELLATPCLSIVIVITPLKT